MTPAACGPVRVHGCGESVLGQSDVCSLLIWQLPSYHNDKLGPIMQKTTKTHPLLPLCVSWRDVGWFMSSRPEVERAIFKSTCTSIYALATSLADLVDKLKSKLIDSWIELLRLLGWLDLLTWEQEYNSCIYLGCESRVLMCHLRWTQRLSANFTSAVIQLRLWPVERQHFS